MDGDEQHTDDAHTDDAQQRSRLPKLSVLLVAALVLVAAGAGVIGVGLHAQRHAPQPPASAAVPIAALPVEQSPSETPSGAGASGKAAATVRGPILAAAVPTRLSIPSIGVAGSLLHLGLNSDQTVQVPPQTRKAQAGWYRGSPTPGQLGPAIILGHVDSAKYGPGVFFKLGALHPGAMVSITRADHSVAVFRVDRVVSYSKNNFPTLDVYGNTDHAALRLITCGGKFDFSKHSYESNIVAYASLVSSHKA